MTTQTERGTCTGQGLVHVEHLTKHYRKTPALRDYSLSLDAGHIVGLMGPNGCGKTTLLKILAGVLN
ncbi:MAG: ATP-binding cassette domain-containing protein, partial [Actinomyces sp.]|nr:ATP-binding cassette domain-containing protein [Actinomyces sp.]